ncbi:MAG TPA: LysR family transcriptional regulator [Pyrinomonadaceae bacterium]|nr:LysR family transcriptional regulator [Pyrinomonadaceae bacterium]
MEIWQLRTFREVAETLNFTKASEKLHLTQSAISHQIKALETEFGVPLFIRAKRGVILTDAGKIALEYTTRILQETEEMRERVAGLEKRLSGRVRVAAATQALVYLFAPLFEDFMDAHENIELVFRTTTATEQTVEDIQNGVADVGFASLAVYSPTLEVTELFDDELVLVVGKKHRLATEKEIKIGDLNKERWILFERGASIRRATDDFFTKFKTKPETALESNDTYFVKLMIEHGLGVSLLPSWAVREEVKNGKLAQIRFKKNKVKRSVSIISLKGAKTAPIRAFIEYILDQKENLQKLAEVI